jgi:hypothetical protein
MAKKKQEKKVTGRLGKDLEEQRQSAARAMFRVDPSRSLRSVSDAFKAATGMGMNQARLRDIRDEVLAELACKETEGAGEPGLPYSRDPRANLRLIEERSVEDFDFMPEKKLSILDRLRAAAADQPVVLVAGGGALGLVIFLLMVMLVVLSGN